MKTKQQLLSAFDHACSWNAFLYTVHKASATALTFWLYAKLSTRDFSLYANINSAIFLLLLWFDFGFKKSIARFIPEYERLGVPIRIVLNNIIRFRSLTLVAGLYPLFYWVQSLEGILHATLPYSLIKSACLVFLFEGCLQFSQLLFHAYFLNKYFNILSSAALVMHSLVALFVCMYFPINSTTVPLLLYAKAAISFCAFALSVVIFAFLNTTSQVTFSQKRYWLADSRYKKINWQFRQHSVLMWLSTIAKSLTERNALIPLLTYTLGSECANLFKVANEGALFFYRTALKTVGSNDTALLAHAKIKNFDSEEVFDSLKSKIATICFFVVATLIPIFAAKWYAYSQLQSVELFIIMTLGYMCEVYLSPYERIIEVERNYRALFRAYLPYFALLCCMIATPVIQTLGLLTSIILIHGIRLLSALLLAVYARMYYKKDNLTVDSSLGHAK